MSIKRAPRPESGFYILDKKISEDKRLSWAARGLLIYLLGKPDHWKVSVPALVKETAGSVKATGRDGVHALLRELKAVGYIHMEQARGDEGKFNQTDYIVSEAPAPLPSAPLTAEPFTANPTQVSTESKQELITPKNICADGARVAGESLPEWLDQDLWASYVSHYHELQNMKGKTVPDAWEAKALRILSALVADGYDPTEVVEQAVNSNDGLLLPTKKKPSRSFKGTTPANGQTPGHMATR